MDMLELFDREGEELFEEEITKIALRLAQEKVQTMIRELECKIENYRLHEKLSEYESREYEIKRKENEIERRLKNLSLEDLLGRLRFIMWRADTVKQPLPEKCDLCDDERYIWYTKPSGKQGKEKCHVCGVPRYKYEPVACYVASMKKRPGETLHVWYKYAVGDEIYGPYFVVDDNIYSGQPFGAIKRPDFMFFQDEEDCQKFCDWLNKKNGL